MTIIRACPALLVVAACGAPATPSVDALDRADATGTADAATGGDPVGTWAARRVLRTVAPAPVGGPATTITATLTVLTIAADGDGLAVTDDPCEVRMASSSALATPSLVPGYAAGLPTATRAGAITDGALVVPLGLDVVGAALAQPASDPLPTTTDAPTVIDADADGQPGLTVRVAVTGLGVEEVYVVQRTEFTLRSTSLADDRIGGALEIARFEQRTIGASNPLFADSPEITLDRPGSRFDLVRQAPGYGCAELVAADEVALFGPR
ncbi:MAG: hypothetical protein R2939_15595 [Kofleriaceae bacterium]